LAVIGAFVSGPSEQGTFCGQ